MTFQLKICGILLILLAALHVVFPRRFDWKNDCAGLSLLNRQIMYIHTLFLAVILLLMGMLCLAQADALATTSLGRVICGGLAAFWILRLIVQFVGYSRELWRGKAFETGVHICFAILWTYFSAVFVMAAQPV